MSDFRPGVDAARKALGAGTPIVHNAHPGGAKGVRLSLLEVAQRIQKGRNDPRVRAWAIRAIHAAGGPQDTVGQAQAILTAYKKACVYVQDPINTEFMQAAHETLCLDDKGLCFRGGDCDDGCIAYGSATLSVGIPTKIIGEKFNFETVPTHVLCAIQDTKTGSWLRVDPSTNKPVGEYVAGTGEEWIDPMKPGTIGNPTDGSGDFVGVGRIGHIPVQGLAAATPTAACPSTVIPWTIAIGSLLAAGYLGLKIASDVNTAITYRGVRIIVTKQDDGNGRYWVANLPAYAHAQFIDRSYTGALQKAKSRIDRGNA